MSKIIHSFPAGKSKVVVIPATAGNVDYYASPGAGKKWQIIGGLITIVTDATVANRYIFMYLYDVTNTATIYKFPTNTTAWTASQTREANMVPVAFAVGHAQQASSSNLLIALTPLCILAGIQRFYVHFDGGVAGDSYSGCLFVLEVPI